MIQSNTHAHAHKNLKIELLLNVKLKNGQKKRGRTLEVRGKQGVFFPSFKAENDKK